MKFCLKLMSLKLAYRITNAIVSILNTDFQRARAVLIDSHSHKLICFNVYSPNEDDNVAEEFNFQ